MASRHVGEVLVKVTADTTDFMKQLAAVRDQAEAEFLAMRLRRSDPLARRIREMPNSALRKNIIAIADGDEFWLHNWAIKTRDGDEYMEVVWLRPADMTFTSRLPLRLRVAMWLRRITLR